MKRYRELEVDTTLEHLQIVDVIEEDRKQVREKILIVASGKKQEGCIKLKINLT